MLAMSPTGGDLLEVVIVCLKHMLYEGSQDADLRPRPPLTGLTLTSARAKQRVAAESLRELEALAQGSIASPAPAPKRLVAIKQPH